MRSGRRGASWWTIPGATLAYGGRTRRGQAPGQTDRLQNAVRAVFVQRDLAEARAVALDHGPDQLGHANLYAVTFNGGTLALPDVAR